MPEEGKTIYRLQKNVPRFAAMHINTMKERDIWTNNFNFPVHRNKTAVLYMRKIVFLIALSLPVTAFCQPQQNDLYKTIVALDSIFFTAYNTCDLKTQAAFYADSIEFYHDKGGLNTSKKSIMEGTEKYVCGKVTRELVKGSIEVSPIPNYGAVEIGMHMFHNNQEKDQQAHASKFVIIWKNDNNKWTITRVISLH